MNFSKTRDWTLIFLSIFFIALSTLPSILWERWGSVNEEGPSNQRSKSSFKIVEIEGELKYPGVYFLPHNQDSFKYLFKRSGYSPSMDTGESLPEGQPQTGTSIQVNEGSVQITPMENMKKRVFGLPININHSSVEDLKSLPGIGPVIANRIIDLKKKKGGFHRVEELLEVKGIGKKRLSRIKPLVFTETPP